MVIANLKDRLIVQKREIEAKAKETYIEREQEINEAKKGIIAVIIGPRRAGKSTFAVHKLKEKFGYVNFDDEKLVDLKDYDDLIEQVNAVYGNPKTLFLDEVQNVEKWELLVNRLQRQGFDLVVSGSNANILSKELATHLTGRHSTTKILPLSFSEYLEFFKLKMVKGEVVEGGIEEGGQIRPRIISTTKGPQVQLTEAEIKAKFDQYLEWGGYPEPLVKKLDYKDYLSTLFDSVVYKDIVKRFRIRNPGAFEDLALYVVSHAANPYSYNTLAEVTKVKSPNTVEKYLNYLEEAFLIFRINRYSQKVKDQLKSDKKIYCIDNGLISAKGFRIFDRPSEWHENVAAVHLWKKHGKGLFYYKSSQGGYEVDFVVRDGTKITQLIQVSYDLSNSDTKTREFRSLITASKELRCDNLTVLTHDYEAEESFEWFGEKRKIRCIPLWKWLLE